MNSSNNNEILDFDQLFDSKPEGKSPLQAPLKATKSKSLMIIGLYFLVTIIIASIIQVGLLLNDLGTRLISSEEAMVEKVSQNIYGLGYINQETFDLYEDDYPNIKVLLSQDGYIFIANKENPHLNETYTIEEIVEFYQADHPLWADTLVMDPVVKLFVLEDTITFRQHFSITFSAKNDYAIPKSYVNFTSNTAALLNFVVYLILACTLVPVAFKLYKFEFSLYFPRKSWLKDIILGYGFMFVSSAVATVLVQIISMIFNYAPGEAVNQMAIHDAIFSEFGFLIIIVTIVFAPLFEELVFRKAFFSLFKNAYVALVFTSLLFGLIHVVGETSTLGFLTNWITYSASGFALGYIYIKNNHNIWSSIVIHAVYNTVAVILMLFVL